MEPYTYDYMKDNNYENEEEEDESHIKYTEENEEGNYLPNNQNEGMFGVFDEINENFEEIYEDMNKNKLIEQKMSQQVKDNYKRLNQKNIGIYNPSNNYEDDFNQEKKFQYTYPSLMNKQITDISRDNNNYKNFTTNSNYDQINDKGELYSNNYSGINDDPELNNYVYKNNENQKDNYLNLNTNEIKKGFIKKSNSNINIKNDKFFKPFSKPITEIHSQQ